MLSTQLIILNYLVILSYQCSTKVSFETNPLYSFGLVVVWIFASGSGNNFCHNLLVRVMVT